MSDNTYKLNADEKLFDAPDGEKLESGEGRRTRRPSFLVRGGAQVTMGQRAKGHVFMPDKWVFPAAG